VAVTGTARPAVYGRLTVLVRTVTRGIGTRGIGARGQSTESVRPRRFGRASDAPQSPEPCSIALGTSERSATSLTDASEPASAARRTARSTSPTAVSR